MSHNEKTDVYLTIAKNVKKYRCLLNMTQEELAIKSGYSYSHIKKLEAKKCKKSFSIETVYNISLALGIDVWKLFKD